MRYLHRFARNAFVSACLFAAAAWPTAAAADQLSSEVSANLTSYDKIVVEVYVHKTNHKVDDILVTYIDGTTPVGGRCGKDAGGVKNKCDGLYDDFGESTAQSISIITTKKNPTCMTVIYGGAVKSYCKP